MDIIEQANEIAREAEVLGMASELGAREQEFVTACCVALAHTGAGVATAADRFVLSFAADILDDGRI